ncbi:unnamed protein product [Caenorhabditis nigoni]
MSVNTVISVFLKNEDIWIQRYPHMEMISKAPTPLTPTLQFKVSGLSDEIEYDVSLTLEKLDLKRYGFDKKTHQWAESKKRSSKEFHIPESIGRIGYGKDLKELNFEKIKISSRSQDQNLENVIYVQTMQKYVPVITITNLDSKETVARVTFEMAQFIPVSIYQDQSIGKWKAQHNKYATVRYGGKGLEQKKKTKTPEPILNGKENFILDPLRAAHEVDKILNYSNTVQTNTVNATYPQYQMTSQIENFEQYPSMMTNYSPEMMSAQKPILDDKENQTDTLNSLGACHETNNYLHSSNTSPQNPMTSQSNNSYQYPSMMNNPCYAPEMLHGYSMNYNCYSGYYSNYQMPHQPYYSF